MCSAKADLLNAAVGAGTILLANFLATWFQRHLGFATPLAASSGVGLAGVVAVVCAGPGMCAQSRPSTQPLSITAKHRDFAH